jgi:hypothetical protein
MKIRAPSAPVILIVLAATIAFAILMWADIPDAGPLHARVQMEKQPVIENGNTAYIYFSVMMKNNSDNPESFIRGAEEVYKLTPAGMPVLVYQHQFFTMLYCQAIAAHETCFFKVAFQQKVFNDPGARYQIAFTYGDGGRICYSNAFTVPAAGR